jgi:serine protease Do
VHHDRVRSIAVFALLGLALTDMAAPSLLKAQEIISVAPVGERTSLKPVLPESVTSAVSRGVTEVELEPELSRIIQAADSRSSEPRSLDELRALDRQQSKVAEKIQAVTVNVQQGTAQGSGVIITSDGYVLTAAHVAGKPNRDAWLLMSDGRRVKARTLGMNRYMDAGLLKIVEENKDGWEHASLGTSKNLKSGQWCIATGHPGGWVKDRAAVIRVGRILSLIPDRTGDSSSVTDALGKEDVSYSTIVTDCALIGGDSGGPLFDLSGKLIGIHSRIGTDVSDNMHVPVDVFSKSWDRMVQGDAWGTLPGYKPAIGVIGNSQDSRAVVSQLLDDSPAKQAGLRVGDVIRRFDGSPVNSFQELIQAVEATLPGDRVRVEIERDGKILTLSLVVGLQDG